MVTRVHVFMTPREDLTNVFALQDGGSFKVHCDVETGWGEVYIYNPHDSEYMLRALNTYGIRHHNYRCETFDWNNHL